jgi:hypothetical protein
MPLMAHAPRALIALLVGTVAFFALWTFALKPSSSGSGSSSSQGLGAYQSAIAKAHHAVTVSNQDNERQGATIPQATPAKGTASKPATPSKSSVAASKPAAVQSAGAGTKARVAVVTAALSAKKVVVLLFYNPAGADDNAIKQELAAVPTHHGAVVKVAAPIGELSSYPVVTGTVPVTVSPTLVLINAHQQAMTIVGFADQFEIAQRVADALAGS